MSLIVNDSLQNNSPKPVDAKYGIFASGSFRPYATTTEANSTISPSYRSVGLTALINTGSGNTEYWYQGGIADGNLVPKLSTTSVSVPITLTGGVIGIQIANTSQAGYVSAADWNTFNGKISGATSVGAGISVINTVGSGSISTKSITGTGGVTITDNTTSINIGTVISTGSNVGTGAGLYASNTGAQLNIRSIITLGTLVATQNTSDVTLSILGQTIPAPVTTSNAVQSALSSVTIENNSAGVLEVTLVGIVVGTPTTYTMARRYAKYYKIGGIVTVFEVGDLIAESLGTLTTATWTIAANGTTNNIDVLITGQTSTNIKWTASIQKYFTT